MHFVKMLARVFLTVIFLISVNGKSVIKLPIHGRIVGGEATTIDKYPYQVSIIYMDSHFCGGSIINPTHILTAAHCTNKLSAQDLYVRAGSTIVNSGGQFVEVDEIFQHNQFDSDNYDYDISILRLAESLNFGSTVASIELPAQSSSEVPGDLMGTATGWGRLSNNGPLPMELQKVDLPTISIDICDMVYGSLVTVRMLCAGYAQGGKDTCQGDSGGPFVVDGKLIGITSWGDGCGAHSSPGVYTKVSYFRDYIEKIVNN